MLGSDVLELLLRLLLWIPVFVLAICIHEAAHAWAAWKLGDPTAVSQGRLTLNPLAHFDPAGISMFLLSLITGFGFGWAKPVPINPVYFRHPSRDIALVASAGPASNILQALLWTAVLMSLTAFLKSLPSALQAILQYIFILKFRLCMAGVFINLGLAFFNLIPIPPLDGSKILRLFLSPDLRWRIDYLEATGIGFIIFIALLFLGVLKFIWIPVDIFGNWLINLATQNLQFAPQ